MTMCRKGLILRSGIAVLALLAVSPPAHALTLAEGGKAKVSIVLPANPAVVEKLVAEDLVLHLDKITGARFAIVAEAAARKGPAIWVGMTRPGKALRAQFSERPLQTLLIRCDEEGLVLSGTDAAGTRHAVYEWLYRLGCRWYTPYDWGAVMPKIQTLELKPFTLAYASPFVFRHGRAKNRPDPYNTWKRRNHSGGDESGWLWHGGGHSWVKTLIPTEHFKEHPEWFALINGKRNPGNLCPTNAEVQRRAGERVLEWQRRKKLRLVCVSPSDHAGLCECENCRKLKDYEQILLLANAAAHAMRKEFPDAYVTFYANYNSFHKPDQLYPRFKPEPNVMPWVAYRFPDWARPMQAPTNRRMQKALSYWGRQGNPLGLYTYGGAYSRTYAPVVHCLIRDIPYLRKQGVIFVYDGGAGYEPRWALHGLNHYVQNRLLWRPDADPHAMLEEYCRLFFGPAAGTMRAFYGLLENSMAGSKEFREDYYPARACYYRTFPLPVIERAGRLLDKAIAEAKSGEPIYGRRLVILRGAHEFVRLDAQADSLRLEYGRKRDPALLRRAVENLKKMIGMIKEPANKDLIAPARELSEINRRLASFSKAIAGSGTSFGVGTHYYKDYLDGGGRVPLDASSWKGFRFGNWGLELAPRAAGALVYAFAAEAGCRFRGAAAHLYFPCESAQQAKGEKLEISADEGKTWTTVFGKRGKLTGKTNVDLTPHVAGKTAFRLRFSARNETDHDVFVLDLIRVVVRVAAG